MEQRFSQKFNVNRIADRKNLKHLYPSEDNNRSLFQQENKAKDNVVDIMYQMMHAERPIDPRETFRQYEVKGNQSNEDDYMNKTRSELLVKVARDIDQASKITKQPNFRLKEMEGLPPIG